MTLRSRENTGFAVLSAVLALTGGAACDGLPPGSDGNAGERGVTVRDSAGIEIVENHAPQHPAGTFWSIEVEPEIVLGGGRAATPDSGPGAAADDAAQLIWRVSGLARLEDGRIAVLSTGNHQLYLFEPSGELSRMIGGRGEGPGEFARPQQLQYLPPDTLVVWDYWFAPTSYFDTGGRLLGERTIDLLRMMEVAPGTTAESRPFPLPDGSVVVVAGGEPSGMPAPASFARLPPAEFLKIDDSYSPRSLGLWEGWELWRPREQKGVRPGIQTFMLDYHLAAGGSPPSIYISNGDRDEIHQFSMGGDLTRIIRRTTGPVPVTEAAQDAWKTALVAGWDLEAEAGQSAEEFFAGMPLRDGFPPVAGLVVDTEGFLWVREWSASEAGMPDQWSVFGADGRWLGVIAAWPDLRLCHRRISPCWIDREFLLAVRRDELGIERVEGYRIHRSGR